MDRKQVTATGSKMVTSRQSLVAEGVANGLPSKTIAHQMNISEPGVNKHIKVLQERFGARNRTDLVSQLWMHGILQARSTATVIVLVLCVLACMPSVRSYRSPVRTQTRVSQAVRARSRDEFHQEIWHEHSSIQRSTGPFVGQRRRQRNHGGPSSGHRTEWPKRKHQPQHSRAFEARRARADRRAEPGGMSKFQEAFDDIFRDFTPSPRAMRKESLLGSSSLSERRTRESGARGVRGSLNCGAASSDQANGHKGC